MTAFRRDIGADIGWGLSWGLLLAAALSVTVLVLYLVRGPDLVEHYHTSLPAILGVYVFGGTLGGVVVGLCRPLAKRQWGAALVGMIAAAPVGLATRILQKGFAPWQGKDTVVLVIFCVTLGGLVGWIYGGMSRGPSDSG